MIEISADVTPTNLSNLAIALNKVSTETGVVAVTSTDNTRIILTSDDGDDISMSKLGANSPAFLGRFIDDDGVPETSPIGTVTVAGALKTPLASTSVVTNALLAGPTVSTNTVSGSGADLNLSSDTSGNYTVVINSGGVGAASPYVVGETFTIDGTLIGGTTGTHDVTITVGTVDGNGVITSATATGFAPGITQAQTTLSSTNTDGSGSGATFDVTIVDGVATVAVNAVGDGYDVGDEITILGSAIGGTDGVNDLTISVATLDPSSLVSFGTVVSGNRIDTARFSGSISLSSSASFTLTETNGTASSVQDPSLGGLVNIRSNVAGDVKRIEYDISDALESGGSALNGLRAVAPRATYQLTVPSSNSSISFSSTVSNSDLSVIDKQSVNKAIVREIREQAPITSLSAGATVSQTQVVSYSFQRTEAVQPTVDSVNLIINGTSVSVDLNDIDGSNTAASSAAVPAIIRSVNNAGLGVTAAASGTPPNYGVTLTANSPGVTFTVESFEFNDVNETVPQTQFSLTSETPALSVPEDGTSVALKYGDQIYNLAMREGEVIVSGPEPDRLTAYFDSDSRLQIFGGGSLSGSNISVLSNTELSGNSESAEKFGLVNSTTRLTGQLFTLTSSMNDLELNFAGQAVTVSLDLLGNITTVPSTVTGLTLHGSLSLRQLAGQRLNSMASCVLCLSMILLMRLALKQQTEKCQLVVMKSSLIPLTKGFFNLSVCRKLS